MKHPFTFLLSDSLREQAKEAAADRDMSLADWVRQAILAYLKSHKKNKPRYDVPETWPSGYPRNALCFGCGECSPHDPVGVHVEELMAKDMKFAHSHVCKPR